MWVHVCDVYMLQKNQMKPVLRYQKGYSYVTFKIPCKEFAFYDRKYVRMILYGKSQSIGRGIFNILLKEVPDWQKKIINFYKNFYKKIMNKILILCRIKLETSRDMSQHSLYSIKELYNNYSHLDCIIFILFSD